MSWVHKKQANISKSHNPGDLPDGREIYHNASLAREVRSAVKLRGMGFWYIIYQAQVMNSYIRCARSRHRQAELDNFHYFFTSL